MTGLFHTHKLVVLLFVLIYLIKTVLLLANKTETLERFTKKFKIPEMIISTLFLVTGVTMLFMLPTISMMLIIKVVVVFLSIPVAVIGFKKKNKILASLSLVMIFGSYGLAEAGKKVRKIDAVESNIISDRNATNYDIIAHGKAIYKAANCKECHGEKGDLGLVGAKDLTKSKLSEQEVINIISNGKNAMRKYKAVLDKQEIKAAASYVKELRK